MTAMTGPAERHIHSASHRICRHRTLLIHPEIRRPKLYPSRLGQLFVQAFADIVTSVSACYINYGAWVVAGFYHRI
jgi:hypothetical protein